MAHTQVLIGIKRGYDLDETRHELERAGLVVEEEKRKTGTLTGHVQSDLLARLRSVQGVFVQEGEQMYDIGPPDSAVQ